MAISSPSKHQALLYTTYSVFLSQPDRH